MAGTTKPAYGVFRRALGSAMDWMMGKELVGKDGVGNSYYRCSGCRDGSMLQPPLCTTISVGMGLLIAYNACAAACAVQTG